LDCVVDANSVGCNLDCGGSNGTINGGSESTSGASARWFPSWKSNLLGAACLLALVRSVAG
jgi:hypothetical protein